MEEFRQVNLQLIQVICKFIATPWLDFMWVVVFTYVKVVTVKVRKTRSLMQLLISKWLPK